MTNTNPKYVRRWLLVAVLGATFACPAAQAELYIYHEKDGTRWITDHRIGNPGFTYIGRYGRPTATQSCVGVTPSILEARAHMHMATVSKYAAEYDVDPLLVKAVISVESCFDTFAESRVGAKGLMQLMPSTARRLGVDHLFNPKQNIKGGVRYLSKLLKRYDYNLKRALAAYNAGPQAIDRYNGVPPFAETQSYVKRVLNKYHQFRAQIIQRPSDDMQSASLP
ncbi:MAG: lytic transglycosylase domain-containing protein [Gammaproteobacteria bacterium]|jgi:hypothetical protein